MVKEFNVPKWCRNGGQIWGNWCRPKFDVRSCRGRDFLTRPLEEIVEELKGCIYDRVSTEVGRGGWVGLGEVEDFDPKRRVVNEDKND